ncbi:MAG: glycosyl transferase, partial [Bacteroidota bacterium]|nr:glycosyl transferase [Bacteroidota bacterium]
GLISILRKVSGKLILRFGMESDSKWKWFEPQMSYDNGILPLALLHAYEILRDKTIMSVALESLTFLDQVSFKKGYLSPVGTNGWYPRNGECIQYSQQSIDVMAMVLMYHQAFKMTGEEKYYNRMFQSFKWFLGKNDLYIPLFDHETNGCCDGLDFNGVNRNQGAESSLGYLISHLIVSKTFESYNKKAEANLAITDRIVTGFLKS